MRAWIGEPDYEAAAKELWNPAGIAPTATTIVDAALASMTQVEVSEERAEWTMRATRSLRRWVSEWIEVGDE